MEEEKRGHDRRRSVGSPGREKPEKKHGHKRRSFHENPADAIGKGRAPGAGVHDSVARSDALQGKKHNHGHYSHGDDDPVIEVRLEY